jgi:hypothetical protein
MRAHDDGLYFDGQWTQAIICSGSLGHLELVVVFLGLAIVCPGKTSGSISFLLRVRLLLERADSTVQVSTAKGIFQVSVESYLRLWVFALVCAVKFASDSNHFAHSTQ